MHKWGMGWVREFFGQLDNALVRCLGSGVAVIATGVLCKLLIAAAMAAPGKRMSAIVTALINGNLQEFILWVAIISVIVSYLFVYGLQKSGLALRDERDALQARLAGPNPHKQQLQRELIFREFKGFREALQLLAEPVSCWHPRFDKATTKGQVGQLVLEGLLPNPDSERLVRMPQIMDAYNEYRLAVQPLSFSGFDELIELRWQLQGIMDGLIEFHRFPERLKNDPAIPAVIEIPARREANGLRIKEMALERIQRCYEIVDTWLRDEKL